MKPRTGRAASAPTGPPIHQGNRRVSVHSNSVWGLALGAASLAKAEPARPRDDPLVADAHRLGGAPLGDLQAVVETNGADLGGAIESHADAFGGVGQEADRLGVVHPLDVAGDVAQVFPHSPRATRERLSTPESRPPAEPKPGPAGRERESGSRECDPAVANAGGGGRERGAAGVALSVLFSSADQFGQGGVRGRAPEWLITSAAADAPNSAQPRSVSPRLRPTKKPDA